MLRLQRALHVLIFFSLSIQGHVYYEIFKTYNKNLRPEVPNGATNINIQINVLNVNRIDESNHEFSLNFVLYLQWNDDRLNWKSNVNLTEYDSISSIDFRNKIWIPDVSFRNCINCESLVGDHSSPNYQITLYKGGDVLLMKKMTGTFVESSPKQPGSLFFHPFNKVTLSVPIEPFGSGEDEISYNWNSSYTDNNPIINSNLYYQSSKVAYQHCSASDRSGMKTSCLLLVVEVKKYLLAYFTQIILPMKILFILSYINLFINPKHYQFRVVLPIVYLLTAFYIGSNSINSLMKPYVTLLNLWYSLNLVIFATFCLEYLILFLRYYDTLLMDEKVLMKITTQQLASDVRGLRREFHHDYIDRMSKYSFPCFYILINGIFWIAIIIHSTTG